MMAVLADGMGGRSGGSIAAEQVVRTAQQLFSEFSPLTNTVEQLLECRCERRLRNIRIRPPKLSNSLRVGLKKSSRAHRLRLPNILGLFSLAVHVASSRTASCRANQSTSTCPTNRSWLGKSSRSIAHEAYL